MKQIKIVGLNARFTHSCLALFYVRNELAENCPEMEAELYQFTINDNYYEMVIRLSAGNPRYIFFSAAIWNSSLVERLTRDLRICLPQCRVVIGGPQASVLGDRLGADNCTVVIGEIEAVGRKFYTDLTEGSLQPRYTGSFFKMAGRSFAYPYRESDFHSHLRNRHIYYESSRGCPFSCSYCLSAAEKGIYHKNLAVVEEELGDILRHRPKVVRFIDRTFNDRPDRALAIWQFLAIEGGDTLFHFEMAPDRFTEEMFAFLATVQPGRFQFELGIQSTNPSTLEAVKRRVDPLEAHRTVSRLAGFDTIHLHVDLILGLPHETRTSFANSFRDVFAMGAHYIQMGLLKILPDTPICHGAGEDGYQHSSEPPYAVFASKWLDHATLCELYWFSECVEKFFNNRYFVSLWRYLRSRQEDSFAFFEQLLGLCHGRGFFQLAATQELMCSLLVALIDGRDDRKLITELLRYDWLRCGFRFLPDCLKVEEAMEQPESIRSALYQSLPEELAGVYGRANRNQFFRKSFFTGISPETLIRIGLAGSSAEPILCVLAERDDSLFGFNKVVVF
ncbi:MAG: hypothetical protein VR65_20515 [Desulfobulbaceae bacterium BRH_c16a]|nr:MAG: hypothetical protein VR65_20515 [Desulfobulbaceae bacterium BRH_c16a]